MTSARKAKRIAQEKHGHFVVHSWREFGHENNMFGEATPQECRMNRRVRIGIARSRHNQWRKHV